MLRPFAWTQAWVIARISEWANAAIRWLMCCFIDTLLLGQRVSLVAEQFQIGQALFLRGPWKKSIRIRLRIKRFLFHTKTNWLYCDQDPVGPSSRLLLLRKVGRQLVR